MNAVTTNTTAIVDSYHRLGWYLVPLTLNTKSPSNRAWTKKENCIGPGQVFPPNSSIGIALAYSGLCSFDIDNLVQARAWFAQKGIDVDRYLNSKDTVQITSGVSNHGKIIWRMPASNPTLPCHAYTEDRKHVFQFRNGTRSGTTVQDVAPFSIHPDTGQPYQWMGDYTRIPELPAEFLQVWLNGLAHSDTLETKGAVQTSEAEVESALAVLDPDLQREEWLKIAMGIHSADPGFFQIWADWSSQGVKFVGYHDCESVWNSFHEVPNGVTILSLFKLAREAGWQGHRRAADEVFKPIAPPVASMFEQFIERSPSTAETPANEVSLAAQQAVVDTYWPVHDMSLALEQEVPAIQTLVPDLIPMRGLTGLVGAAGHGKSNFMLDLAWAMTTEGCLFRNPAWPARQGTCFVLEAEDDVDEARRRLQDLARHDEAGALVYGKGEHKIYFHNPAGVDIRCTDSYGNPTKFVDNLIAQMKACPQQIVCLLVGPLINLSGGSETNEDTQSVLRELERVGREVGCAVIVPHHVSKSSAQNTDRSEFSARGGGSFSGTVRAQLHIQNMGADEAKTYHVQDADRGQWVGLTLVKANGMRPMQDPVWLRRNENSATMCWTSAQPVKELELTTKDAYISAVRKIKDLLISEENPWPAKAFAEHYGGVDGVFGMGNNKLYAIVIRACDEALLQSDTDVGKNGKRSTLLHCGQKQRGETVLADTEAGVVFAKVRAPMPDFLN